MKTWVPIVICFLISIAAYGQSADERNLSATVTAFNKAMLDGNRNILDSLTSSELSYGHSNGRIEDKQTFVSALASGKADFISLSTDGQTIQINGDIAVVRHKLTASIVDNGAAANVVLGVMLVWQKMQHQWQLVARQACKL